MYNITCAEIQTPVGFLYAILPAILNQTLNPDCEQGWYSEDGLKIADPSNPQTMIDPVISVSSDRLITSYCVNLNHQIICDSAAGLHYNHKIMFRVRNETVATPNPDVLNEVTPDLQHSDQLWWFSVPIFIALLAFLCFLLRKRIIRCFQREARSICQCEDSENRCKSNQEKESLEGSSI